MSTSLCSLFLKSVVQFPPIYLSRTVAASSKSSNKVKLFGSLAHLTDYHDNQANCFSSCDFGARSERRTRARFSVPPVAGRAGDAHERTRWPSRRGGQGFRGGKHAPSGGGAEVALAIPSGPLCRGGLKKGGGKLMDFQIDPLGERTVDRSCWIGWLVRHRFVLVIFCTDFSFVRVSVCLFDTRSIRRGSVDRNNEAFLSVFSLFRAIGI